MASLITNYTELQFTKKSWEFVSSMENFPFDKLPQKGSGSRGTWTMKDVKASLPKPEKKNPHGIFASGPAKKLFENSKISEDSLKDKVPSGKKGFTVNDIKKLLPKPEKKNSLGIFASKAAKELFEKSGLSEDLLENPSGKNKRFTVKDVRKILPKEKKKKKFFASQVAEDLAKASDLEIIKEILQKEKPKGKSGLYSKAEVEQALLKKALKKEED
tara:strand:- start:3057 stop:3704 length:648 start_codon:yes stop_codon:yes gene_type:complete